MTRLGELDLDEAANDAAGNWKRFNCFIWHRLDEMSDSDDWAIIYTHNRDSGLLDQSNAAVISKTMQPFSEGDDPDVVFESHHHWAVGHVDGFSVKVFNDGQITEAFRTYHALAERMAEYPILDESDYSERECNATFENIGDAAWRLKDDFDLPDEWQSDVFDWLSDRRSNSLENRDDQGGYPREDDLEAAFAALGYQRTEGLAPLS